MGDCELYFISAFGEFDPGKDSSGLSLLPTSGTPDAFPSLIFIDTEGNDYLRALKTALETAIDWGYIKGLNLKKFKQYKLDQAKPVYMTADEVSRLLQVSQDDPEMKYAVPVMCYCAISRGGID